MRMKLYHVHKLYRNFVKSWMKPKIYETNLEENSEIYTFKGIAQNYVHIQGEFITAVSLIIL